MAANNSLLDYVNTPPQPFGLNTVPTPQGAPYTVTPNTYPGTNIPVSLGSNFNFGSKLDADGFNAWLWNQSGGKSGAPMPAPTPEDPRLVAARARDAQNQAFMASLGPLGPNGVPLNPAVRRAIYGPNSDPVYRSPAPTGGFNPAGVPLIKPGLTTTVRNPNQQARLGQNLTQFSGPVGAAKAGSLTQFTQDFLDERAKQKNDLNQEENFVGQTFDPNGLEARLAGINRNRSALARQAAEGAIRRAGRDASISRMVNGGNASYLDRSYADQLGRILLDNAMKGSDISRENAMYVQGQRNSSLGARRNLGMQYVNDALVPYNALTDAQAADLSNIGRIGNIEDNYSLYDYVTPAQAASQNLGMLGDLETRYNRYRV